MNNTYDEILKIWNSETPDDFAIFSELYYQMFGEDFEIPYTTESTTSSFFPYNWMKTTTATYSIQVTEPDGFTSFLKTMPTRPKTSKGIKAQNTKLSQWVEKCYPNFTSYEVILLS